MTLGVMDWGVGGLFAAVAARDLVPGLDVVYRADTANRPYGTQSRTELAASVQATLERLADAGATHILIACHSASTALPDVSPPVPIWGVIAPESVPDHAVNVLVLGGARTIRSGHWRRALTQPGRRIVQRISQPLSAHVEAGRTEHPDCLADLDHILAPARGCDAVILACTHYAALEPAIQQRMPHALCIDPAMAVVRTLPLAPGSGRFDVDTTGDRSALIAAGSRAVGRSIA